ncbi:hypothetical protein [Ottowia sp.]|uniref:hypothetical protein n=1 Tax=Ottowia sp. TaxID=1898956 RepID=UPI0025F00A8D|nr:hypothetical protein [Ottowia sp.]MBK6615270.1 hypothetical protein [Ottowia sp.]
MNTVTVSLNVSHSFSVRSFRGGSILTLIGSSTASATALIAGAKKRLVSDAASRAKSTSAPLSSSTTLAAGPFGLALSVAKKRWILWPVEGTTSSAACTSTGLLSPDCAEITFSAARFRASLLSTAVMPFTSKKG